MRVDLDDVAAAAEAHRHRPEVDVAEAARRDHGHGHRVARPDERRTVGRDRPERPSSTAGQSTLEGDDVDGAGFRHGDVATTDTDSSAVWTVGPSALNGIGAVVLPPTVRVNVPPTTLDTVTVWTASPRVAPP